MAIKKKRKGVKKSSARKSVAKARAPKRKLAPKARVYKKVVGKKGPVRLRRKMGGKSQVRGRKYGK